MHAALLVWARCGVIVLRMPVQAHAADGGPSGSTCRAEIDGNELVVANRYFTRRWRLVDGLLEPSSIEQQGQGEWLSDAQGQGALASPIPPRGMGGEARRMTLHIREQPGDGVCGPSLRAVVRLEGERDAVAIEFRIHERAPAIDMRLLEVAGGGGPTPAPRGPRHRGTAPSGVEADADGAASRQALAGQSPPPDRLEALALAHQHLRLMQIELRDCTDVHNELVHPRSWLLHPAEAALALCGNVFIIEQTLTGAGLIFVRQAPLPHARPVRPEADLTVRPASKGFHVELWGHGFEEAGPGDWLTLICYEGGEFGRIAAMQRWQRELRRVDPQRDVRLLSNTWGDRSRDSRMNETFIHAEIEAAAQLGVDVVQLDDGWQKGVTQNSALAAAEGGVWEGFYAADPQFWSVHPQRFPNGLEPVVQAAQRRGVGIGLWFAPDSSGDFAQWRRDADTVLQLHRRLDVGHFKIDGVKATTRAAQRHLHAFFDAVLTESQGKVGFDLDVTAQVRPGYYGEIEVGPLFLENRYTDWHRYWPHQTLRSLWMLAPWVDPARLRLEFLNPERNCALYEADPLAPSQWPAAYLFATVMFANPLAWMEVSNLSEALRRQMAPVVAVWKQHREAIFAGTIVPIGRPPDGTQWTGLAAVAQDGRSAYALVFRELNDQDEAELAIPGLAAIGARCEVLSGEATTSFAGGHLRVAMNASRQFALIRVSMNG